jgi:two-component system response regulator CpxR
MGMAFEQTGADRLTRLLIIDDDIKFAGLLRDYLEPLGYAIDLVHNGREGLKRAVEVPYDAVILDVMLPGMNGFDVLREIRKESPVPILMLTALGDEPDRIAGLEVGADDYLPKTFSTRELLARLRAVLRRSYLTIQQQKESREAPVSVGPLWIDPSARSASVGGKPLLLTTVEYDILLSLARSVGRVKTREQLLLEVAERDFEAFDRSVDVHVSSLRKKLGDDPKSPRYIETVRSVGYRMKKPDVDCEPLTP